MKDMFKDMVLSLYVALDTIMPLTRRRLRSANKKLKIVIVTADLEEPLDEYIENGIIDAYL